MNQEDKGFSFLKEIRKTKESDWITFISKYKDSNFDMEIGQVFYIKSADNYIDICFYDKNNSKQHKLMRNTLAFIENNNPHPTLLRCHRSFIVNMNKVKSIKGNAGGYKLILENITSEIPVSRKYKKSVFSFLEK